MKKHVFFFVFMFIGAMAYAQVQVAPQWTGIVNNNPETFRTRLVSSSEASIRVNVQVPGFYTTSVVTPRGEAKVISLPKAVCTAQTGDPDLPSLGIPAIIGDQARMDIRVVDVQYMDFEGMEIAPFKGHFSRQIDPATVPYTYGECFSRDAFFPTNHVGLYAPYIVRDFRGQNMVIHPFAYNPVTKILRVYYNMTVEMFKVDDNGENVMQTRRNNVVKMDTDFKSLYQRHFINYEASMTRYTPVDEEGDLLIICYDSFINSMSDFVNWKKTRGVNTTIVGTSTVGSSYSAIYNYIKNRYNANNNLTHVLLVGDVAQIPGYPYSGGGSSYSGLGDNAYGQVVGNDIYNDIFIGRFSAQTVAQVTTQVQRTITYERDLTASATWCQIGDGISKREGGSGHNGEDDYQHMDNIRTDLLNFGYSTVYQDYSNLSGYTGTQSSISGHINSGVGIVNYCNHGAEQLWGVASYSNVQVNALTNENKLPFIWSVACLVGKYDNTSTSYGSGYTVGQANDCFAEAWMHATNSAKTQPTGAVGALMSYISQPWIPPMWGQDECVDILVESYNSNIKHTWGGTSINGIMGIFDHYSTSETSAVGTYQSWVLYGDPSLMLRTKTPQPMTVTHSGSMEATATSYTVNVTNGNGALATITNADHEILGRATVSGGRAIISLSAPGANSGDLTLCVFGYNKVTYLGNITVGGGSTVYYNITATANPTNGGNLTGAGSYAEGSTCTLTATPATGYDFSKWTKNGVQVGTNASYSFTVSADAAYVAHFTKKNFTITATADPSTGGSVSGGGIYSYGATCTLAAVPAAGFHFVNWTKDGSGVSTEATYSFVVTEGGAYVAHFSDSQVVDITIGSGSSNNSYLPTYSYYNYSLSEQIYTAAEIGQAGTINAIAFKVSNEKSVTRSIDLYMKHTDGTVFTSNTGWESLAPSYKVYSGSVTFSASGWTTIVLDTPFAYNGTSNLLVCMDDNTGTYVSSSNSPKFYVYSTGANRALRIYSDGTNYNPASPSGYSGTYVTSNNQIVLSMNLAGVVPVNSYTITATASPSDGGSVTGAGTYDEGSLVTLTATASNGYDFTNWTKNGVQVSTNPTYSFTAAVDAAYVANFTAQAITVTHSVTVAEVPNGTVATDKATAEVGETVNLTVMPNSGCSFHSWVVFKTGDVNTTVTVNNNRFTMPDYDVTVVALIKPNGSGGNEDITIGSGSANNSYIPTYSYYKYSLTQQIYTATEIGQAGTITAIAFKVSNAKSTARNVDLYMKHTTKSVFTNRKDWEALASSYKVYSGTVTFSATGWTTLTLDTPFEYDGTSNLMVCMDDNTGTYVSNSSNSPKFYVYSTGANRALRVYSDGTDYNPAMPSSYNGTYVTSNNQILLSMSNGVSGSGEILVVTPKTMNGFTYAEGNGPSSAQTFAVIGVDLGSEITVTAPSGYEISATAAGTYGGTLILNGNRNRATQTWGFEGTMDGWTTIDADGDGRNWQLASVLMSGYSISAHGGSDMLSSESYNKSTATALTPDNWLVSPQVTLGGTFTMYACAQDANYAAEHFGIFVSTGSNTNTGSFVKLGEWTLTAKGARAQGSWNQYTVDLSAYAGQTGHIAVRHFNCTDQFYLNVDDFTLTYDDTPLPPDPSAGIEFLKANVYVRLKAGLSQGVYNNKIATIATTGVSDNVVLNGNVTGSRTADEQREIQLQLFPNPVNRNDKVTIALPTGLETNNANVEIFNIFGSLVRNERFDSTISLSCPDMVPGVYTVRVSDGQGHVYYGKLIVK